MRDAVQRFESWFKTNGGYVHPSVEFRITQDAGFSLFVKPGCTSPPDHMPVISCPHSLSLSSLNAFSLVPNVHGLDIQLPPEILENGMPRFIAALGLCAQWLLGEKSFWFDYINVLPGIPPDSGEDTGISRRGIDVVDTPLWWSDNERSWLRNTNVERGLDELHESWTIIWKEWESVVTSWAKDSGLGVVNWRLFKWAMTILGSRSFSASTLREMKVDGSCVLEKHDPHSLLYPGVDLLNHSVTTGNRWSSDTENLSITCHDTLAASDEIWNTYGSQSNSQLLLSWGFVIPNNPDDTFALRLLASTDQGLLDLISNPKNKDGGVEEQNNTSGKNESETEAMMTQVENVESRLYQGMNWPPPTADQAASAPASIDNNMFFVRLPTIQKDFGDVEDYPSVADRAARGLLGFPEALLSRLAAQVANVREKHQVYNQPESFSSTLLYKQLGSRNSFAVADLLTQKLSITLQSMTESSKWTSSDKSSRSDIRKSNALVYHQGQVRILQENLTCLQQLFSTVTQATNETPLPELSTLKGLFYFMQKHLSLWREFTAGFPGIGDVAVMAEYIEQQGAEDLFMMLAVGAISITSDLEATTNITPVSSNLPILQLVTFYTTQIKDLVFLFDPSEDVTNIQTYVSDMRARYPNSRLWGSGRWDSHDFVRGIALLVMEESLEIETNGNTEQETELALCTS